MRFFSQRGDTGIFLIIIVVFLGFLFVSASIDPKKSTNRNESPVTLVDQPNTEKKTLQLNALLPLEATPIPTIVIPPTTTPIPTVAIPAPLPNPDSCPPYSSPYTGGCTCTRPIFLYCAGNLPPAPPSCQGQTPLCDEMKANDPSCQYWCMDKPVIYLYPEKPTYIDVEIITPGNIVVSDPEYPVGGWKNVFAYPNGSLVYNNNTYSELFYETSTTEFKKPDKGIVLSKLNLRNSLDGILIQLGLIGHEKQEFLDYWVNRLQNLESPYILFSILEENEKRRLDTVIINPKPDVFIEFMAYFKPLLIPYVQNVLVLPPSPPQRHGFTAVEWGGILDISQN